ncbi:MAG: universal stress protein [Hyphomicrobiaceae bacterium]
MYKTILVHINDDNRVGRLLDVGAHVAQRFNAHLTGLFVLPFVPASPIQWPMARSVAGGLLSAYREEAERAHQSFERTVQGLQIAPEWRLYKAPTQSYCEAVLHQGRAADLIIASQRVSDWDYADMFDIPEDLVLQGGRPVLVVPSSGDLEPVGSRILVAWNGKREGARAVFDALPLLQKAQDVRVLWIDPQNEAIGPSDIATAEICAALARHGVRCEGAHSKTDRVEVGEELLSQAGKHGSDLLVMGCYGRSRFREFLLGGATRQVLHNMTIPVLMSH